MPAKPSAAALRKASTGNSSRWSQPGAWGSHSSWANWRAVSWNARCSSERVKSIEQISGSTGKPQRGDRLPARSGRARPAGANRETRHVAQIRRGRAGGVLGIGSGPESRGGAKERRHAQVLSPRQPGEHVDPRRGDDLDRGADDERLQQPDPVQSARKAEPAGIYPAGTGGELVVEPGLHAAQLQIAPERQMA